tara:strand:+ start:609 stop:1316 length:708 start_codon:yes stop_codon:yes gene_type:complete
MKKNNFTNHNLVRAPIDLSEYLFKNNHDGTAVHCPQSVSLERAKEVSEVFKAYDGEASDKAYNNVFAKLETRSKYYNTKDKVPVFFDEALRMDFIKSDLLKHIERIATHNDKEIAYWVSTNLRFAAWVALTLAWLDNKVLSVSQLSGLTSTSKEASRKVLKESSRFGYAEEEKLNGKLYYSAKQSTVSKYYRYRHRELKGASLESLSRLLTMHSFINFEAEFISFLAKTEPHKED